MSAKSGNFGLVKIGAATLAEVTKWTWNPEVNTFRYGTSGSAQKKKTFAGTGHGAGTIEFLIDFSDPITDDFDEGDSVTLLLYEDANTFWSIPSVIKSMPRECDIDDGDVVKGSADFESNGSWVKPTY